MKTNEMEILEEDFSKAQQTINPVQKLKALENFKTETDSSDLPDELKDRFKATADKDIYPLVSQILEEQRDDE